MERRCGDDEEGRGWRERSGGGGRWRRHVPEVASRMLGGEREDGGGAGGPVGPEGPRLVSVTFSMRLKVTV